MGNTPSRTVGPPTTLDSYVEELGQDIQYDSSIGYSRFLKTIKAHHPNGPMIVKVFLKSDPGLSLLVHRRRLKADRELLAGIPNVHSYQAMVETDRAAYLIRQYLANDLYDRISTRPFLADIEKKWLAFQLLTGMSEIRARKLSHGDLKPSNILISSSLHLFITDLSPFKPVYLPEDDPSDFSFFFSPSPSSRSCYLAPERFFSSGSKGEKRRQDANLEEGKRDGKVTEEMDVFSAGVTLAEMWSEGREVFDLSGMLRFRKGESTPEGVIRQIPDEQVQEMIRQMISLSPSARPTFATVLQTYRGTIFPEIFYTFLHEYAIALSDVRGSDHAGRGEGGGGGEGEGGGGWEARKGGSDERVGRIWEDWEMIKSYLEEELEGRAGEKKDERDDSSVDQDGPALLILNLITADLRACHRPTSQIHAMEILLQLARYTTDEAKLDRIVPFLVALLTNEEASVRASAVYSLTTLVETVQVVSPTNMALIPDYILPQVRHLGGDDDVEVRVQYATCLASLTETAERFLDLSESFRSLGGRDEGIAGGDVEDMTYEQSRDELQTLVQVELSTLLSDPSPFVKRAILANIAVFCIFLGRSKTDEVLLSHMLTFLNDSDWLLRWEFFERVVGVAALIGEEGLEALILPLFLQALSDPEESVLARVLASMKSLTELGMFSRIRLWEIAAACLGLFAHPNVWIRQTSIGLLAAIANRLNFTDVWCVLYPSARLHLRSETASLTETALLDALLPCIPRPAFDSALQWAAKSNGSPFWSTVAKQRGGGIVVTVSRNAQSDILTSLSDTPDVSTSVEDEKSLNALRQKGLGLRDEQRLAAMRQHLLKLSRRQLSAPGPEATFQDAPATLETVPLNSLNITPRNIFFNTHPSGPPLSSRRLKSRTTSKASLLERRPSFGLSESQRSSTGEPFGRLKPLAPLSMAEVQQALPSTSAPPSESIQSLTTSQTRSPNPKSAPSVGVVLTNASAILDGHSDRPLEESEGELVSARTSPVPKEAPFEGAPTRMSRDRIQGYDGTDPNIIHFLEVAYLDSLQESAHDFGPRINPAAVSSRRKASASRTTVPSRANASTAESSPFTFLEASSPVDHLSSSPDQIFFVTSHRDNCIRVWDSARLERNISSKPRLVHQLVSSVTALCFVEDTHCLAVACSDGTLSILRMHISSPYTHPKFREIEVVRYYRCDQKSDYAVAMSSVSASDGSMELVVATVQSLIFTLDLCSMRVVKELKLPLDQGPPSCVYADRGRQWVAIGTSLGFLSVWDARFALPVRSWKASSGRIRFCLRHPLKSRWLLVAGESSDGSYLQSFEVETCRLVENFTTSTFPSSTSSAKPAGPSPSSGSTSTGNDVEQAMARILAGRAAQQSTPPLTPSNAVLAVAVQPRAHQSTSLRADGVVSGPTVFTSGISGRIRCLNFADLQRSKVLATHGSEPKINYSHATGEPAVLHETGTAHPTESPHMDTVTSLCIVSSPVSSTIWLLTGSLSGAIVAWKV